MTPFAQLCLLIRCALRNEPDSVRALEASGLDAGALAPLAFRHRVAAFLAPLALDPATAPLLPADLRACLLFAHETNGERNQVIRAQLSRAIALLNARGVEPVLLKGAGRLVDGVFPDASARFMQDLDLLIAPDQIETAAACLRHAGYAFSEREERLAVEYHHMPSLWHPDEIAGIELHRTVISHWHDRLLPTAAVLARAAPVELDGNRARVPAPLDGALHLVAHGQLQHDRLIIGEVLLSEVVEFVLMARQLGGAGTSKLVDTARTRGFGLGFASFARICELTAGERLLERPSRIVDLLARRSIWQQTHGRMRAPGRLLVTLSEGALILLRYPSVLRRFPGRFAEKGFYTTRWRDFRRALSR